jgi:hypothetical protein
MEWLTLAVAALIGVSFGILITEIGRVRYHDVELPDDDDPTQGRNTDWHAGYRAGFRDAQLRHHEN